MNDDTVPDVGRAVGLDGAKPPSPRRTACAKAVASALAAVATFAASATVTIGGESYPWTYAEQSDGTIVLGGGGNMAAESDIDGYVQIPASIKGKPVTAIGKYAFRECSSMRGIIIPESVKKIEEGAFFACTALCTLKIPEELTDIDDMAFSDCWSLADSQGFVVVNDMLFGYCGANAVVSIPSNVKRISSNAFCRNHDLVQVTIPFGVTNVGEYAFAGCSGLSSVLIPSTVTGIGGNAFEQCPALASVRFIGDAPVMGKDLFTNPPENAQVTLPVELAGWSGIGETWYGMAVVAARADGGPYSQTVDGVTWTFSVSNGMAKVGSGTFGSPSIPRSVAGDIAIPSRLGNCDVSAIGEWAFRYCDKLTSVAIPEGVTSIGTSAFEGCSSLRTAAFPSSVAALGDYSFYNCSSLKRVMFKGVVLLLGDYAFCGCTSLESAAFAGDEPDVGQYAFYSCPATAKVFVPPSASGWAAPGNTWNGMKLHHAELGAEVVCENSLPEFTVFGPETSVKISPVARAQFTAADAESAASGIQYLPSDIDQEVRFFKSSGVVDADGAIIITAQLDLEAMEFSKTSGEVCEKMASAGEATPTITLSTAKPGFWYAVAVADNLADLETAEAAAAARASGDGVSLTIPKPEGGTAFFKVTVNTQEIPLR